MKALMVCLLIFVCSFSSAENGSRNSSAEKKALTDTIEFAQQLALNPVLITEAGKHNKQALSLSVIKERDNQWRLSEKNSALKLSLKNNVAGKMIVKLMASTPLPLTEIFATGKDGANFVAIPATSDYWQGDESKWINAYNNGNGKLYIGPVMYDKSTLTMSAQICVPIYDGNKLIGILIVGVKQPYIKN